MTLSRSDIDGLARLARIPLAGEEAERMRAELGSIVGHLGILRSIGGTAEPEPGSAAAPLRPDVAAPDPLLVPRPGETNPGEKFSSYHLVKPFKFGLDPAIASRFDGRQVSLEGTLIYRGGQTMIEVSDDSIKDHVAPGASQSAPSFTARSPVSAA